MGGGDVEDLSRLSVYHLGRLPPPDLEEERALLRRAQAGDKAACQELVMRNGRLVIKIALRFRSELPLADRCQEGVLGLIRAIDKFDLSRKTRLSTYATWWIMQAVRRANLVHGRAIRLPVGMGETIQQIKKAENRLAQKSNSSPTAAELAAELDQPEPAVRRALAHRQGTISLDAPFYGDGPDGAALLAFVSDGRNLEETAALRDKTELVSRLLEKLSARETRILRLRWGLDDGQPRTLREVGDMYNLTRERIRQIEKEAMTKLQNHAKEIYNDYY